MLIIIEHKPFSQQADNLLFVVDTKMYMCSIFYWAIQTTKNYNWEVVSAL